MPPALSRILRPTVLAMRLVWLALAGMIPIYVLVAYQLSRSGAPGQVSPALTVVFAAAAVALCAIVLTLPRFFPGDDVIRRLVASDPDGEAPVRALQAGATREALGRLDPGERRFLQLRPVFITQVIVRAVLAETIALLGVVLAFMSARFDVLLPFAGVSLVLQLVTVPQFEPLVERARELGTSHLTV